MLGVAWFGASLLRAQDYPFRDTKLSDDQRIADLLGRLTLEEKIDLMSDHPKIPRLGLVFSGQVEGLHGLALGGPAGWGGRGTAAGADDDLSAGEGAGRDLGPGTAEKMARWRATRLATTTRIRSSTEEGWWCAHPTPI